MSAKPAAGQHFILGGGLFGSAIKKVHAVTDVSFSVPAGQSVGLVGESGCGKSTLAKATMRLLGIDSGEIIYNGKNINSLTPAELRETRRKMQFIFQDPYSSLNPRRSVRQTLEEPLHVHKMGSSVEITKAVEKAIVEIGLQVDVLDRLPHEFSGGQRQRIGIARALMLGPEFIIADEPVSALDVSVQAQILKLLDDLRTRRNLSFLFVSHDLGVIRHFCPVLYVMYLGRVVETGPTIEILDDPAHPYTRLLRDSSPAPDPAKRISLPRLAGEIPSPANPPPGCPFNTRCSHVMPICKQKLPTLKPNAAGRTVACHLFD